MVRHNRTRQPVAKRDQILALARERGLLRPRDLASLGIAREYLNKLHAQGLFERAGRGLYRLAGSEPSRFGQLGEVAKRVPQGVVCLLSALEFHGLTTEAPHEVWISIPSRSRIPRLEYPVLRVVRSDEASQGFGVELHHVDGVDTRVFSPAKTVADCFKYRSHVGVAVARQALVECWRAKKSTSDQLWRAAKVCRMTNVMRPYLESLE
jgi:predicted transcriptional regulator of viral defense system